MTECFGPCMSLEREAAGRLRPAVFRLPLSFLPATNGAEVALCSYSYQTPPYGACPSSLSTW